MLEFVFIIFLGRVQLFDTGGNKTLRKFAYIRIAMTAEDVVSTNVDAPRACLFIGTAITLYGITYFFH